MADIAAIFHWPPAAFDPMTIEELLAWRDRALDRAEMLGLIERK